MLTGVGFESVRGGAWKFCFILLLKLLRLMDELEYNCAGAQNAPNDIICTDRHGRGHQL